jgi:branched-chain amino acid transport system ATP-binding protein
MGPGEALMSAAGPSQGANSAPAGGSAAAQPQAWGDHTSTLIETVDVTKAYGDFVALEGVSLSIREGELISIVGPNGAGKTTLVNVITGLLKPTRGLVRFKGSDIAGIGPVRLAELGVARAFQLVHIFPALTVAETIAVAVVSQTRKAFQLFAALRRDRTTMARVREVAAIFGLDGKLETEARLLSQGEKKLLDIASAFALTPELILLDEPTSGVSSADKHGIMRTLIEAAQRAGVKTMILVEHDMDLVAEYSSRIVALQAGKVLADRSPEAFFSDPALIAAVVGKMPGKLAAVG